MSSPHYPDSFPEETRLLVERKATKESFEDDDVERGDTYYAASTGFEEEQVAAKHQFIRNVYGVLLCQLLFTIAVCLIFTFVPTVRHYAEGNTPFFWTTFALALAVLLTMNCCATALRQYPRNFIALVLFTLIMSLFLGVTSAFHSTENVVVALGMACVVASGLSVFGCQTRFDFSGLGPYLYVLFLLTLCFAVLAMVGRSNVLTTLYISLGMAVFAAYLVYDTQMMVNGTHTYIIGYNEVIFAALDLYLDIVNIYVYILSCLGLQ